MDLYHLGNTRFASQLTGEGARLFGGRWNQQGDACIYTSATRSLCVLEYLVNVSFDDMPPDLSFTQYIIPDALCRFIAPHQLPKEWNAVPPGSGSKLYGSAMLADASFTCFAVPSVVVPQEANYILNPSATDFNQIKIVSVERFIFDQRIKSSI